MRKMLLTASAALVAISATAAAAKTLPTPPSSQSAIEQSVGDRNSLDFAVPTAATAPDAHLSISRHCSMRNQGFGALRPDLSRSISVRKFGLG